jgi:hypothetical protein
MRRALAGFGAAAAALITAGCGTRPDDLFVLARSGSIPGARLLLQVDDGGYVRCNRGKRIRMSDDQLLDAREIERELEPEAGEGVTLAPTRNTVLRYSIRMEAGIVRFADTSHGIDDDMRKAAAFARSVARGVCGLAR